MWNVERKSGERKMTCSNSIRDNWPSPSTSASSMTLSAICCCSSGLSSFFVMVVNTAFKSLCPMKPSWSKSVMWHKRNFQKIKYIHRPTPLHTITCHPLWNRIWCYIDKIKVFFSPFVMSVCVCLALLYKNDNTFCIFMCTWRICFMKIFI